MIRIVVVMALAVAIAMIVLLYVCATHLIERRTRKAAKKAEEAFDVQAMMDCGIARYRRAKAAELGFPAKTPPAARRQRGAHRKIAA